MTARQWLPGGLKRRAAEASQTMVSLLFPEDCRVCGTRLRRVTRIPVCESCLQVEPLASEYFCVRCRTPFLNRYPLDSEGVCALCRSGAQGFDYAYAYGAYEGKLKELIRLFKYEGIQTLARPLAAWLAMSLPLEERFDMVVPVPMHWRRRWSRGYDQALLLARELSRRKGLPVEEVLERKRATQVQAGLPRAKRRTNVQGAFRVTHPERVNGKKVLLIDDVLTTGATASSCARELKKAGARHVAVITVARADRRSSVPIWKQDLETGTESL